MREILFRGKEKGQWVYGYYWKFEQNGTEAHVIRDGADNLLKFNHICEPESIGQYTGLTDKNGKKIFEGDILKISHSYDEDDYVIRKVYDYRGVLCVAYETPDWDFNALGFLDDDNEFVFEVIGNIHDNPELLEGDADDQP